MSEPINEPADETTEDPGWTDELVHDPFDDPDRPDYTLDETVEVG